MGGRRKKIVFAGLLLVFLWWWNSLPQVLFSVPYSTVLESSEGKLLGARIAQDGQWRFPMGDSIPKKFQKAIVAFEDEHFWSHPGVDPYAVARAIYSNISKGEVVSGASTLTMQVIRLSRNHPDRTYVEKLAEMFRATRLEFKYSKKEILELYAAHAPFGGNVVGLEAASWRYFGMQPHQLSWAEVAALAVLPNAPGTILPGRSETIFKQKRDALLTKLLENGTLDSTQWRLSLREPLPQSPLPLPNLAPHALEKLVAQKPQSRIKSSLSFSHQKEVQQIVDEHIARLRGNNVNNAAVMVVDLINGSIPVYVGNTTLQNVPGSAIDMLEIPRSTGSVLKPFLYSFSIEEGMIGPRSFLPDYPTRFQGYTPTNFDKKYRGAVSAQDALQQSLNIPAIHLLQDYSTSKFHTRLLQLGFSDLHDNPAFYGLSLILGSAEIRPEQMASGYYHWLQSVRAHSGPLHSIFHEPIPGPTKTTHAEAVWQTLEMMKGVQRPIAWEHWKPWRPVAWKTGTSFGHRDAWSVGTDGRFLVVVWTGNASNEGRPGLIGVEASAPLLFEVFNILPDDDYFAHLESKRFPVEVCEYSGFKAGRFCVKTCEGFTPKKGLKICEFCQPVFLDENGMRTNRNCGQVIRDTSWFILPPTMQWYYSQNGGNFPPPPPWNPLCEASAMDVKTMMWIYPRTDEVVMRTRDFSGQLGGVVLEMGHQRLHSTCYWFADQQYLGKTEPPHQFQVHLEPGEHLLTVTDDQGESLSTTIRVVP